MTYRAFSSAGRERHARVVVQSGWWVCGLRDVLCVLRGVGVCVWLMDGDWGGRGEAGREGKGREGDLSPLGVGLHRGTRMYTRTDGVR